MILMQARQARKRKDIDPDEKQSMGMKRMQDTSSMSLPSSSGKNMERLQRPSKPIEQSEKIKSQKAMALQRFAN